METDISKNFFVSSKNRPTIGEESKNFSSSRERIVVESWRELSREDRWKRVNGKENMGGGGEGVMIFVVWRSQI